MRIKKITATDRYKHIEFSKISDDWKNRSVFTPNGWSKIEAFEFIKRGFSKKITVGGFELICDYGHVLQAVDIRNEVKYALAAKDLQPLIHRLVTYNGQLLKFDIEDGDEKDFYDIQIKDPHWWYTSGIVSHNSIVLCNNAISSLRGESDGEVGQDVLLITFELDSVKTAMRCLGAATGVPLTQVVERQEYIRRQVRQMERTYKKKFAIYEWAPDECSVNHIYALLDNLKRTKGWKPDVIILDYMDLMMSRVDEYNKTDYDRQKHVANEIRGLAKNENVLIFTATQTNRGGVKSDGKDGKDGNKVASLNDVAESYAKQFSLDYIVSLNQSDSDRKATPYPRIRAFIAKNRNGPKHEIVDIEVEYDKMQVRELI